MSLSSFPGMFSLPVVSPSQPRLQPHSVSLQSLPTTWFLLHSSTASLSLSTVSAYHVVPASLVYSLTQSLYSLCLPRGSCFTRLQHHSVSLQSLPTTWFLLHSSTASLSLSTVSAYYVVPASLVYSLTQSLYSLCLLRGSCFTRLQHHSVSLQSLPTTWFLLHSSTASLSLSTVSAYYVVPASLRVYVSRQVVELIIWTWM
ncbi:hypothetical protein BaRGS_00021882 [Batillaria attramentaria]|uniref:Uncharacterized protein n=1 Tax=Batillaria attramentaria TaxID=370345 RepID=A0ABD0KI71_9CAEN